MIAGDGLLDLCPSCLNRAGSRQRTQPQNPRRIYQGVYLGSTDITEFDCVSIGDYAAINAIANLQTHLFEDRVMKVDRIEIGHGCVLGGLTTVLYDTRVGDHARLGLLTSS